MFAHNSFPRSLALHLIVILLAIFNLCDIKIAGFSKLIPLFDLMAVFYFSVFRHVFYSWFLFLLGVICDALNADIIGITPLCYILLVKLFLIANHKLMLRQEFKQIWHQFVAFCFCFLLLKWCLLMLLNGVYYSIVPVLVQFVLSSVIYVLMHKFFDYLTLKLLEEKF